MRFLRLGLKGLGFGLGGFLALLLLFLVTAYVAGRVSTYDPGVSPERPASLLLTNVRLIGDGAAEPSAPSWIEVRDGRIKAIGLMAESADAALLERQGSAELVLDLDGAYVLPGLIDSHTHIFDRSDLGLLLAHGVTTTRNMMGYPVHLRWQKESEDPGFAGARMITASPTLNTAPSYIPFHVRVATPQEARERVRAFQQAGYAFIKIYDGLPRDVYEAILDEAKAVGMGVSGHVPRAVPIVDAAADGLLAIEHIEEVYQHGLDRSKDPEAHRALAADLAGPGTPVTTTLIAWVNLDHMATQGQAFVDAVPQDWLTPIARFFGGRVAAGTVGDADPEAYQRKTEALLSIVRSLHDVGVPLGLSTDTGPSLVVPGYSYHREIELMERAGLRVADILTMATTTNARILEMEGQVGTLRPGAYGDLLVVRGNPLEHPSVLERPAMVIKGGALFDEAALEALREASRRHIGWFATIGILLDHLWTNGF